MVNGNQNKTVKGKVGEKIAKEYLSKLNYTFIEQNFYYNHGEIDLICMDQSELVFIEVKFRNKTAMGDPVESVTPRKQNLIRRTAEGYVAKKNISNTPCRFDVITIVKENKTHKITHYKNAF